MGEEMRREFIIPKRYMEELNNRLKTVKKKCKEYNCAFSMRQVDEITKIMVSDTGVRYEIKFIRVEVQGTAIINGWKFIGMLEHLDKGNIFKACWGDTIPEKYRNQKGICEHCGSNRRRTKTYIIQNIISGEFKQVGGACLKSYTQGWSAERVASMMECIGLVERASKGNINYDDEYIKKARVFDTKKAVEMAFLLKDRGVEYRKTNTAYKSSYNLLLNLLNDGKEVNSHIKALYESIGVYKSRYVDMNKYKNDIERYLNRDEKDVNDGFFSNMKVLLNNEYCSINNLGYIAYLPYAVEKYKELMKEKSIMNNGESEWLYNIGDKVELQNCYIRELYKKHNPYARGMITAYRIMHGCNVYIWFSTKEIESGEYNVKGVVKDNRMYQGEKQTYLTRCKIDICKE